MSELEDRDRESIIEKLDEVEKELAECLGHEEEEEPETIIEKVNIPIGQPLIEWDKRGYVRIKEVGDEKFCYLRVNRGKEVASVSKDFDFSAINLISFDYRHTYQTKSGQLRVRLDDEILYDTSMRWGEYKCVFNTSGVNKKGELRFELISRNSWYSTGNVNLYLYTMTGSTRKPGVVSPVFEGFDGKETAVIKQTKMGALVASEMIIRNVGKSKGKIYVVFSDLDKNEILATGSCTLDVMETIFPFIYSTKSEVTLSKGGYGGYAYVKGVGKRHLGIKIWGHDEEEPDFSEEDNLQMKTWTVNIR